MCSKNHKFSTGFGCGFCSNILNWNDTKWLCACAGLCILYYIHNEMKEKGQHQIWC